MSNSSVRDALVASVAWTVPPVSRHSRKLVDGAEGELALLGASRARRRHCRASTRSWSPRNTDRARSPVRAVTIGFVPVCLAARRTSAAVRRSCQTIALWIGLPVARSHTSVVSRWLVMPIAAMSAADAPAFAIAARQVADDRAPQILRVVLDPAGRGKMLREFLLRHRHDGKAGVEQYGPRRGRALIDGEDVRGHQFCPSA